jgi:hypothetical protein
VREGPGLGVTSTVAKTKVQEEWDLCLDLTVGSGDSKTFLNSLVWR